MKVEPERRLRARLAGGQVPGRRRAEEPAGRHRVAAGRPAAHRGRRPARSPTTSWASSASTSGGRPSPRAGIKLVWVTDFPLFEGLDAEGRPIPAHHPFTMPHPDDLDRLESDPLSVRSQAYDLVLNGWELGSGSVRIHRSDVQQRIFSLLGIDARGRPAQVRVPARRLPPRGPAPRRLRLRHRPAGGHPGRRGEHPRGHRLPQDPVGRRPLDRRPHARRRAPAGRAGPAPAGAPPARERLIAEDASSAAVAEW